MVLAPGGRRAGSAAPLGLRPDQRRLPDLPRRQGAEVPSREVRSSWTPRRFAASSPRPGRDRLRRLPRRPEARSRISPTPRSFKPVDCGGCHETAALELAQERPSRRQRAGRRPADRRAARTATGRTTSGARTTSIRPVFAINLPDTCERCHAGRVKTPKGSAFVRAVQPERPLQGPGEGRADACRPTAATATARTTSRAVDDPLASRRLAGSPSSGPAAAATSGSRRTTWKACTARTTSRGSRTCRSARTATASTPSSRP